MLLFMYNRFFPYNVSNILAGIDIESKVVVYSNDPIGHWERANYQAGGTRLQPDLDNQIDHQNIGHPAGERPKLNKHRAVVVAFDTFILASKCGIEAVASFWAILCKILYLPLPI